MLTLVGGFHHYVEALKDLPSPPVDPPYTHGPSLPALTRVYTAVRIHLY